MSREIMLPLQLIAPNADREERHKLTRSLENDLRERHAVESIIQTPRPVSFEEGTKGGVDPAAVNEILLVTLPTALPALIVLLQGWLLRQQNQMIEIKLGDRELKIPRGTSPDEIERYIAALTADSEE